MKIVRSGATPSAIVELSRDIKRRSAAEGIPYLHLERGVPAVQPIDLRAVAALIDLNSPALQTYPPSTGQEALKAAIDHAYFGGRAGTDRLFVTPGGSMGLDLAFQVIDADKVYLPEYHWGTYRKLLQVRRREAAFYPSLDELHDRPERYAGAAVVLCDPNNPVGDLQPAGLVRDTAARLGGAGAAVIVDSPYRRVFFDEGDDFHKELASLENVVIVESFSKSLGLSGLRLGFVRAPDAEFAAEFGLRLALPTNGVDNFAQAAVEKLLAHPSGREAAERYRTATAADAGRNIAYLDEKRLLAARFYERTRCVGIFAVVDRPAEELLAHRIGSISRAFFTATRKAEAARFARVNVAVPHADFKASFDAYLAATRKG
jgi:aspartate/methionine/tyrosine aminotransferase